MSRPTGPIDLVGNHVTNSSTDLALSTTLTSGASSLSNNIKGPNKPNDSSGNAVYAPVTGILFVQLSSGQVAVSVSVNSGTPSHPGGTTITITNTVLTAIPVATTTANGYISVRLTENAGGGATAGIAVVNLLILSKMADGEDVTTGRGNAYNATSSDYTGDGSGTLTLGNS